ncbi:hypothetical protein [Pendulispora albinea]|uniref:Uncharacterized protein n=1 Tax=Pendulispora albinea TaxID=2741071 RepID=A0ABZ2LU18_9BACT
MGFKLLGKNTAHQGEEANQAFTGPTRVPDDRKPSVASKSSIASKATVGGNVTVGGGRPRSVASRITDTSADDPEFSFKKLARWFAIVLVAMGVGVGFTVFKRARAEVAAAGPAASVEGAGPGPLASLATADADPDKTSPRGVIPTAVLPGTGGPVSRRAPTKSTG